MRDEKEQPNYDAAPYLPFSPFLLLPYSNRIVGYFMIARAHARALLLQPPGREWLGRDERKSEQRQGRHTAEGCLATPNSLSGKIRRVRSGGLTVPHWDHLWLGILVGSWWEISWLGSQLAAFFGINPGIPSFEVPWHHPPWDPVGINPLVGIPSGFLILGCPARGIRWDPVGSAPVGSFLGFHGIPKQKFGNHPTESRNPCGRDPKSWDPSRDSLIGDSLWDPIGIPSRIRLGFLEPMYADSIMGFQGIVTPQRGFHGIVRDSKKRLDGAGSHRSQNLGSRRNLSGFHSIPRHTTHERKKYSLGVLF